MPIDEKGKWKLEEDTSFRGGVSVVSFPAGKIIEITRVSGNQIIGPELPDWANGYFIKASRVEE